MSEISFEDLYSENKSTAEAVFLLWVNDFLEGYGGGNVKTAIDPNRIKALIAALERGEKFPACGGFE